MTFHGRKVGHDVTPGRFHARRRRGRGHRARADRDRDTRRRRGSILDLRSAARAPRATSTRPVTSLVVGGSPGMTGARLPRRARRVPRRRGLRDGRGAREPAAGRRAPAARGGQAAAARTRRARDRCGRGTVLELVEKAGALAIGPGLGRSEGTKALVRRVLARGASCRPSSTRDALFGARARRAALRRRVLTPHSGELGAAARRGGRPGSTRTGSRPCAERPIEFGCVVLLKGAGHARRRARGRRRSSDGGDPSLATAGTGDVLTGVVAAFLAKGMDARLAAAAARRRTTGPPIEASFGRRTDRERPARRAAERALGSPMHRSEITIDLGAVRRNVRRLRSVLGRSRALGRRQGRRLRARRGRRRRRGARRRRVGALRGDRRRGAAAPARVPGRAHPRPRARAPNGTSPRHATPISSSRSSTSRSPRASASTSSSTRAWAAGACPSCRRRRSTSSG